MVTYICIHDIELGQCRALDFLDFIEFICSFVSFFQYTNQWLTHVHSKFVQVFFLLLFLSPSALCIHILMQGHCPKGALAIFNICQYMVYFI